MKLKIVKNYKDFVAHISLFEMEDRAPRIEMSSGGNTTKYPFLDVFVYDKVTKDIYTDPHIASAMLASGVPEKDIREILVLLHAQRKIKSPYTKKDYLLIKYGGENVQIEPRKVVRSDLPIMVYEALAHMLKRMNDDIEKENESTLVAKIIRMLKFEGGKNDNGS